MTTDYIGNSPRTASDVADARPVGYVVSMPPVMSKRTEVGERIWRAMKANNDSLADLARAFKHEGLPIRSVGGLRYMMEQSDRYDERVITYLSQRYGHSRSYWLTGVEDVAPPQRSMDRLGAYITGTFMQEVQQTVFAEARRLADAEWSLVLGLLDEETQRVVQRARDETTIRGGVADVRPAVGPAQPRLPSSPIPARKAS